MTALVAALPWCALLRHDQSPEETPHTVTLGAVARTRLGWAMAALFGLQSLQAYAIFGWFAQVYRDAGFGAGTAGLLLGVVTGVSIPLSFWLPSLCARLRDQTVLICGAGGLLPRRLPRPHPGAGGRAPGLWAVLIGIGTAVFPVVLTLIGLRSRTPAGTAALSGFTQSVGYLIAAAGPFGVGLLYDVTGGWTVPLSALMALTVPQLVAGLTVARPCYIEDQLDRAARPD